MPFIVKLQQSLYSSDDVKTCLIYNKSKSIYYETDVSDEIRDLIKILKGRPKAYFKVRLSKDKKIQIIEEVAIADW